MPPLSDRPKLTQFGLQHKGVNEHRLTSSVRRKTFFTCVTSEVCVFRKQRGAGEEILETIMVYHLFYSKWDHKYASKAAVMFSLGLSHFSECGSFKNTLREVLQIWPSSSSQGRPDWIWMAIGQTSRSLVAREHLRNILHLRKFPLIRPKHPLGLKLDGLIRGGDSNCRYCTQLHSSVMHSKNGSPLCLCVLILNKPSAERSVCRGSCSLCNDLQIRRPLSFTLTFTADVSSFPLVTAKIFFFNSIEVWFSLAITVET